MSLGLSDSRALSHCPAGEEDPPLVIQLKTVFEAGFEQGKRCSKNSLEPWKVNGLLMIDEINKKL